MSAAVVGLRFGPRVSLVSEKCGWDWCVMKTLRDVVMTLGDLMALRDVVMTLGEVVTLLPLVTIHQRTVGRIRFFDLRIHRYYHDPK